MLPCPLKDQILLNMSKANHIEETMNEIEDIFSSGMGDELTSYHRTEVKYISETLSEAEKGKLFDLYADRLNKSGLSYVMDGEVGLMTKLFGQGRELQVTVK